MPKDIAILSAADLPTRNVVVDVHILPTEAAPRIVYECAGLVPRLDGSGAPILNGLGRPAYRDAAQSYRYQRQTNDPGLVSQLMASASSKVLQGGGLVDVYTALERTAMELEARLAGGEALPVTTTTLYGPILMAAAGIPA